LNLDVVEPDEQQREELAIAEGGVLVRGVAPGPALDAGIRAGDAILQLNNRAVTDLEQFRQLVDELPAGRSVPVLVQRDRRPLFLALRLPEVE
jgi:serine protease Do